MAATPNLLYTYNFIKSGSNGDSVDDLPTTGGTPAVEGNDVGDNAGFLYGLAVDASAGVYFVSAIKGADSYIYEEHFGQSALSLTPLNNAPVATTLDDQVSSLALNASDDILYYTSGTGFYEEKFTGANFTGTPTKIQLATLGTSTAATDDQLVFDQADHTAFVVAPFAARPPSYTTNSKGVLTTTGGWTKNYLYKVSNVTSGASANSLTSQIVNLGDPGNSQAGIAAGGLPLSDGKISGVALDSATDTLYIITKPGTSPKSTNVEGLYAYVISGTGAGTLSAVWSKTDPSGTNALNDMDSITVDPVTGDYYVSVGEASSAPGIYEGNIGSSALPKLILALPGPSHGEASGDVTNALVVDPAPTVAGAAVKAIDGSTSRTTGTVSGSDTVTLSVTFSESVNVTGTPSLTLNDGGSAHYVSGAGTSVLAFSYTPGSGQDTPTLATTGAVSGGSFTDLAGTPADLTNLAQSFSGLRVQTTGPSFSPTSESADVVQGASTSTTLLVSDTISDPDGNGQIDKAVISIESPQSGDALSIPGVSGNMIDGVAVNGLGGTTLTFTGAESIGVYESLLASVTYQDQGIDSTTVGHPTRTFDWTVDDGVFTSTLATTTVFIDRPPNVTAGASATFDGGQAAPTTLDPGLTVTDLDGGNLTGATVEISSGYIAGDTLIFSAQNGISGTQVGDTLTLSGVASVANYQSALASVTYGTSPNDDDPTGGGQDKSRTISWTVSDGVTHSSTATSALSVVHEPPVLNVGGTAHYSEIGLPVTLDPDVSVSDPDSGGQLQSVVVQISSGFESGDLLSYSLAGADGVTPMYNSFTHSYVFSGQDTLADYQSVLSSLKFSTTAGDTSPTSRTITWTVSDGVASNAATETSSVDVTPCFVRGARILTERGEVAVEDLKVGDLAITASGRRRPIVWIGHRAVDVARHPDPAAVRPVRVRAGAFGEALPRRDLWLSPGHNLACEGALIAASLLINDRSVAQIAQERVEYWHVELDAHDVLLAEGLPVESYLDTGNRTAFANGGAFVEAHPDFAPRHWADTCLPLLHEGSAVVATRARLLARLATQGYGVTQEADAHVRLDGLRVQPIRLGQTRLAFALPAGGREIALRSQVFVPAHTLADSTDPRALGLCVSALQIDGSPFALEDDEACGPGWRQAEYEDGVFSHRWTTGETALPAGARFVIVDLAGVGCFWAETDTRVAGQAPLCDRPPPSRMNLRSSL